MDALTYTKARASLKDAMDRVCENHEPLTITRRNEGHVVMVSLEDFNAMTETMHLLRSPRNASRLTRAIEDISRARNVEARELVDGNG